MVHLTHFFHTDNYPTWRWATQTFKPHKIWPLSTANCIPRSALYLRRQSEFEAFRKTQKMFSRLKRKDWWKVTVPWVLPFHWLQRSKHSLNTNTVTRQLHQHATFSYSHTHHINSHQRYLAAHSCTVFLQRSARTVRKLLARASRVVPFRHRQKYLSSILKGYLQSIVRKRNTPRKPRYIKLLQTE